MTMNTEKEYQSETLLFSGLASGADATNITKSSIDFLSMNNAFDNLMTEIKSKTTLEETGHRLLALHLVEAKENPTLI